MENSLSQEVILLTLDQIIEPVEAMRTDFDRDKLDELAESIKTHGLINPITVRRSGEKYEIVAGHRRFRACGIALIGKIPAVIREMSDQELLSMRAHENLFREDIDPVDEALYVQNLVGIANEKIPEVAKMLNRSVQWINDRLEILLYPDYFLQPLKEGRVPLGVARALAQIEDEYYRKMFFDQAVRDGMKQWQAQYYLDQWKAGIFKSSADIVPLDSLEKPDRVLTVRQKCAKCGGIAESPNLTNVFVHHECPDNSTSPS